MRLSAFFSSLSLANESKYQRLHVLQRHMSQKLTFRSSRLKQRYFADCFLFHFSISHIV